jgi:hypothetical protein
MSTGSAAIRGEAGRAAGDARRDRGASRPRAGVPLDGGRGSAPKVEDLLDV